jgi:hypothetical protein
MYSEDETSCTFVGSRGLLKSCQHRSPYPRSSSPSVDWHIHPENIKEGDTIYICSSALFDFTNRILPQIKTRFILVSGDSDASIPTGALTENAFTQLINSEYLIVWFSQNLVFSPKVYPKVQFLPIGLDYHTMSAGDHNWGPKTFPKTQEELLFAVLKTAPPLINRTPTAYTTFHFALHRGSRREAYEKIPKDLVYYEPAQTSRLVSWKRQSEYAFVVSPPGEGLDCHRTWEALCLGCIPIMISTPLDDMFEGLPVLIVKTWSDVTRELLDKTLAEIDIKEVCLDKLQLKYWVDRIHSYRPTELSAPK